MNYWQSHHGYLAFVVVLCLGTILLTEASGSVRSEGEVIGGEQIESCSWPEDEKRIYLPAVRRLAQDFDVESGEIFVDTAKNQKRREQERTERLKQLTPIQVPQESLVHKPLQKAFRSILN